VVAVTLIGCGGAGPHPTDPVPVTETRTGDLGPHAWSCPIEIFPIDTEVNARVTPASLYLELRTGPCNGSGAMVGASATGTLTVRVPHGSHHLRVGNPADVTVGYSLTVHYLAPSV